MLKYQSPEEKMADSLPHNLAFIDMLISDLTQDLAKENQAQQGTEEHDAWMQIWGNVQRLQQLKESLDTKLNFKNGAFKVCKRDIPSAQDMLALPEQLQTVAKDSPPVARRQKCLKVRDKYRGPYRSYTMEEKQHVIELHHAGQTFASISKELSIPQKNVVRWCKEGEMGKDMSRRVADVDLERSLADWIRKRSWDSVSLAAIQRRALQLSSNPEFKASRGWLKNFMRRMGFDQPLVKLEQPEGEEEGDSSE